MLVVIAASVLVCVPNRANGQTLTTLHLFSGGNDGHNPAWGLVQGSDGYFYGTTADGDPEGGYGTIFQISSSGTLTTLYHFSGGADGGYPSSSLLEGTDGCFYGVTSSGGANGGYGTVFKVTSSGALTTSHSFSGTDGNLPRGKLVQGKGGDFYGVTIEGGTNDLGTVFMITPAGTLTTLHMFGFDSKGSQPYAGLAPQNNTCLYGTTEVGGANGGWGTVFKITTTGKMTSLYSFSNDADGGNPFAALVKGRDGHFYGTTSSGGTNSNGSVFKISPAGKLKTLYRFTGGSDGATPEAALVRGTDGNFYGTTSYGGSSGLGTAFKITPAGTLTTLHEFGGGTDGSLPYGGLVQGSDGSFYGTAWAGGTNDNGTVFKLTVPLGRTRKD